MKKVIVILALFFVCPTVFSANTTLDKIENSIYGFTYSNESDNARLERLEEKIYGKTSSGQTQNRIAKLKKDLSADMMGQEITPKEDTFMNEEDSIVYEKEPPQAQNMDYPVINELEKQMFQKEFKGQNIKTRLSNLEKKTFNKTYDNDDLATRVERLRAQIKPQSFMANGMDQQGNAFYDDPFDKMAQDYHIPQYGNPYDFDYDSINKHTNSNHSVFSDTKTLNIGKIEKKLYNKKFENESTSLRLSRIESSVFGTSFPNDNESERIQRISSAIQAQKSAKRYDSNRFSQNMATAVQIGTLILMVLACIL